MPVVVLLGAPGAGKGTQAPILSACLGVPILASGELLRTEVAAGSELGREVDAMMKSGELVPDETIVRLLRSAHGTQKDPAIVAPLAAGLRDTDACVQRMAARNQERSKSGSEAWLVHSF